MYISMWKSNTIYFQERKLPPGPYKYLYKAREKNMLVI